MQVVSVFLHHNPNILLSHLNSEMHFGVYPQY